MKKRKSYSPDLKFEAVMKVLKEEAPMTAINSEYGVHPNMLAKWLDRFLRDAPGVFKTDQKPVVKLK